MSKKKIFIGATMVVVAVAIAVGILLYRDSDSDKQLLELKERRPELGDYIDNLIKYRQMLAQDKEKVDLYLAVAGSWKSLADQTRDLEHYRRALKVYEQGIEKTDRKNTVFLNNAGNMAVYLKDYALAEDYYKEAISVAPGDIDYYDKLLELYSVYMNKSQAEMLKVVNQAMQRVISVDAVDRLRARYIK